MTQADRVHSTPPTNTSALPVDPTRRRFLSLTIGAVTATIAPPASATAPANDPVFDLIEMHRRTHAAHVESLALQSRLERKHGIGSCGWVSEKPCNEEDAAFDALVTAPAITVPGLIAWLDYLQELSSEFETEWMMYEPHARRGPSRQLRCLPQEYRGAIMSNVFKFPGPQDKGKSSVVIGADQEAPAHKRNWLSRENVQGKIDAHITARQAYGQALARVNATEDGNLPAAQIADAHLKAFEAYSEMTEAAGACLSSCLRSQRRSSTCCSILKRTSAFCHQRSPAAPAMDNRWRSIFCAQCGCRFERFRTMADTGRRHEAPAPIDKKAKPPAAGSARQAAAAVKRQAVRLTPGGFSMPAGSRWRAFVYGPSGGHRPLPLLA